MDLNAATLSWAGPGSARTPKTRRRDLLTPSRAVGSLSCSDAVGQFLDPLRRQTWSHSPSPVMRIASNRSVVDGPLDREGFVDVDAFDASGLERERHRLDVGVALLVRVGSRQLGAEEVLANPSRDTADEVRVSPVVVQQKPATCGPSRRTIDP